MRHVVTTAGHREQAGDPKQWRCSLTTRWLASFSAAGFVGIGASFVIHDLGWGEAAAFAAVVAVLLWRFTFHPRIGIDGPLLRIVNPLRSRDIPLASITSVSSGYEGLHIETQDGRHFTAWAVQKANFSTWTRRRTRSDRIADSIMLEVGRHRS